MLMDLKNDPQLIQQYIDYHQQVWPEIIDSIRDSGILDMKIYHAADRLVMIIQVSDEFSFEAKAQMDADNPKVQEWERLMRTFQSPVPFGNPDEPWWFQANEVFNLLRQHADQMKK